MHTPLLVGMLLSVAVAFGGTAAFYIRSWLGRRRDVEYLLFGLSTLGWAAIALVEALIYWTVLSPLAWLDLPTAMAVVLAPAGPAAALQLHFALRYARVRSERTVMQFVYGFAALFVLVSLTGNAWADVYSWERFSAFGFDLHRLRLEFSAAGLLCVAGLPIMLLAATALLGRASYRRSRFSQPMFFGAVAMALALCHDLAFGVGLIQSIPLLPLGLFALSFGVALSLVARYGSTAVALEARTGELEERSAQLDASYRELKHAQKKLIEKEQLAAIGELAAVVAHEVRNPLAVVSNAVASLQKGRVRGEQRDMLLGIIDEEMERLEKLVSHLLDYARPVEPNPVQLDLRDLLERSMSLLEERPDVKHALDVAADVPSLSGDPDLLRQAFENVVVNAAQAMNDHGSLEVSVKRERIDGVDGVAVDFSDDGEGMSEEDQAQALAPFFTTRPTGTGLGLPIVGRIVEAHGGAVDISSEVGGGTIVRLHLPADGASFLRDHVSHHPRTSLLP